MIFLMMMQGVAHFWTGETLPLAFLGLVHPTVLLTMAAVTIDLALLLRNSARGHHRRTPYLAYGAPLCLVLIILRLADFQGQPLGASRWLIGSVADTPHVSLVTLGCFLLLSMVPLFGRSRRIGAWLSLTIFATITATALAGLGAAFVHTDLPPSAFTATEAFLFLGLVGLSVPLSRAMNLLHTPETPRIDTLLALVLGAIGLRMLSDFWFSSWSGYEIPLFILSTLLAVFLAEQVLRPLERAAAGLAPAPSRRPPQPSATARRDVLEGALTAPAPAPLPHAQTLVQVRAQAQAQAQAKTQAEDDSKLHAVDDDLSGQTARLPRPLRFHHWLVFQASYLQRFLWVGLVLYAVSVLPELLFQRLIPELTVIWWAVPVLAYYLLLTPIEKWRGQFLVGTVALILARFTLGAPAPVAFASSLFDSAIAGAIAAIAAQTLEVSLVERRVVHFDSRPQAIIGFLLSALFSYFLISLLDDAALGMMGEFRPGAEVQSDWLTNLTGFSLLAPLFIGLIWKMHFGLTTTARPIFPAIPLTLMLSALAFVAGRFPFEDFGASPVLAVVLGMLLPLTTLTLPTLLQIGLANFIVSSALLFGAALNSQQSYFENSFLVILASSLVAVAGAYKQQRTRDRLLRTELLENSPSMMITLDSQYRISTASDRICAYLGAPREEIIGRTPTDAGFLRLPEQTIQSMRQFLRHAPDKNLTLEIDLRRRDGSMRKALAAIHRAKTPGMAQFYIIQITDTTEISRNSRLYKLTLEEGPALLLVQDSARLTLDIAPALCKLLGYSRAEMLGKDMADLTTTQSRSFVDKMRSLGDAFTPPPSKVLEFTTKSGRVLKMTAERRVIDPQAFGEQPKYVVLFSDVTELEAQRSLTETLLNRNAAIVISQDRDWRIQSTSDAWTAHFGYTREETLGRDLLDFIPEDDHARSKSFRRHVLANVSGKETMSNTLSLLTKSGERRIVELRSVIEQNEDNWLNIIMVVDITEVSLARQKLEHLVAHDELTGLLSRRGFKHLFADGKRRRDVDLFMIDVDHFKSVNDAYGHEAGDELLRKIARVLSEMTGKPGYGASRIGGEEFAIIRPATQGRPSRKFAEELAAAIAEVSVSTSSGPISRTVSVGLIRLERDGGLEEAIKWADWALREAKADGRNKIVVADDSFSERLRQTGMLTSHQDIITALKRDEIVKYVQPIFDARDETVVGFEALMRWERPSGEVMSPRHFLPQLQNVLLAEDFAEVPGQLRASLLNRLEASPGCYVSFNTRLEALSFPGAAKSMIREFNAMLTGRHRVVLEICEDAITDRIDMDQAMTEIAILRNHGFLIALDDFGKEASNLNRLTHLPIDIVKIDKSLIDRIVTDRRSREALRSIIYLADALEFEIIAEGVETTAQRKMLLDMGLHLHQGFLYARPMPATEANHLYPDPAALGAQHTESAETD
ncbi:PAS domain S-box-containing protein/diguanylate cyclase (GGDEF) domain-containing protein [Celeribacter neptunius]|uniref:PAS domain S-box-containing protein/diguanylate cyclase (GGDEF) domain-containing protein n=2 Tax=Celeribacter neptunius TaxID=588602 RepID=A0A1I3LGC0_9RHOB|nr:PAS domain S-box-containing protein/diguanylate cyclase (GGDEF) domain-containing protein [Celeribacter neptunius]